MSTVIGYQVQHEWHTDRGTWFNRGDVSLSLESARAWRKMLQASYSRDAFRIVEITTSERVVE